ncbi:hypothetical protein [Streptomyces sp. NPDC048516]|uniref:hypothetical protein n=1 Tax=Streptomyces sp. NPDC048516 TaxID=3365565 RepID=UPI00371612FC
MNERDVSCTGKRWWLTRAAAKREANGIRRRGGPALRVYPCRYCGCHHLGNPPGQATYTRRTRNGPVPLHQYIQERTT